MPRKQAIKTKRKIVISTLIVVVLVFLSVSLFYLSPLSGYTQFYSKVHECARWPVVVGGFGHSIYETVVPYYYTPPRGMTLTRAYIGIYCTPLEAEQHGFSASSKKYETPELDKYYHGKYCITATSPKSETAIVFPYCTQK